MSPLLLKTELNDSTPRSWVVLYNLFDVLNKREINKKGNTQNSIWKHRKIQNLLVQHPYALASYSLITSAPV